MTPHTFTDAELAARDAAIRSAALAEAVKVVEEQAAIWQTERDTSPPRSDAYVEHQRAMNACLANADAIRALAPTPPGMVCVPVEPTEAIWSNELVRALIFWQRLDHPAPARLFAHCKNIGVVIPQWLQDETEMQNLTYVTSKGTVAVLIYRALIAAHGGKE